MRLPYVAGAAILLGALTACGAGSARSPVGDVSEALDPTTQPLQLTISTDESRAASAEIGPDGGSLSATSADGSRFTLEVPPKALAETIEVRMVPLISLDGIPWKSGPVAAVELEPDGQTFLDYVTLTIQPAEPFPADQIIPLGATGAEHDLYIPFLDPASTSLQLRLDHFSSAGASKGYLADIEPWRQRLGGDVEQRLSSVVNAELARSRETGEELAPGFWEWVYSTWKQHVLEPRLAAAEESCAAGRLALNTLTGFERQMESLGHPVQIETSWTDLLPKVTRVCIREEYEVCRDQHIIHRMIPLMQGIARQNELMGANETPEDAAAQTNALAAVEAEGWDLTRRCLHFDLEFESNVKMSTASGSYTSAVESSVPIEMTGDLSAQFSGSADLVNTDFAFKPQECSAQSIPGGGTFGVTSLTWTDAPPDEGRPYGHVTALHLTYDPGQSSETAVVTCRPYPPLRQSFPYWSMSYSALHVMEMGGGGSGAAAAPDLGSLLSGFGISSLPSLPGLPNLPGSGSPSQPGAEPGSSSPGPTFIAKEWAVRGGELFAQKEWSLSTTGATSGTEEGSFKLYHKPQ